VAAGRSHPAVALLLIVAVCLGVGGCQGGRPAGSAGKRSTASPVPTGAPVRESRTYYLSLGDSLAFGLQDRRLERLRAAKAYTPRGFPGYTALVGRRLAAVRQGVATVDYGCPGETTTSFAEGGCPYTDAGLALHDPYDGSQLAAAERFLRAHRGRTALVTLSLGANDLAVLEGRCGADSHCIAADLRSLADVTASRLGAAVRRLRAADPAARFVVVLFYDPIAGTAPGSVPLVAAFNSRLSAAATAAGARVVDALRPFNEVGPQPARLCRLTLYCAGGDVHPSDAGYALLARLIERAAGVG
jgi:lysophospholipase L1-like esterase